MMGGGRSAGLSLPLLLALAVLPARAQDAKDPAPRPAAREPSPPAKRVSPAEERRQKAEAERRKAEAEAQALREEVRALEARVKELEEQSRQSAGRLKQLEAEAQIGASTVEERLKKVEETTRRLPEADAVVSAGEFPGSFRIPGTDAALKIGGEVRVTAVDSFDAIGTDDRFVTSSIPVRGTAEAGKGSRLVLSANPSRFHLDFRTPTGVGGMRAFMETDFAGPSQTLRLRHAFGQWREILVGQTWSTFSDPEADPDGIDFEGLNAISLFRPVQVRYTYPAGPTLGLSAALENPRPSVTGAAGLSQVPDVVLRARWDPQKDLGWLVRKLGHVQLAVALRQIRAEPPAPPPAQVSTAGFGVGGSGRLNTGWIFDGDDLTFSMYAGKGIGRYITDLDSYGGQDAFYDPATGRMEPLPVLAGYLGYELSWTKTRSLRSTATVGWVRVYNLGVQPADSLRETRRVSANLAWSPVPRLDFVTELLGGRRFNKDGQWGQAVQLQIGTRFRF